MKELAKIDDAQDKLMGEQLTAEFKEAVGGMVHVVRVGAMVMGLRARLVSTVDQTKATRGPTAKGTGLKSWLEKYAPEVERSTAYRFEDVAKAVAKAYELPARVAKKLTFEQLVTADPKNLDPAARKAQTDLNGFVAGTSQKSWLDQFKEAGDRGGDTSGSSKKLSPEEERKQLLEESKKAFAETFESLDHMVEKGTWKAPSISDALLDASVEVAREYVKQASAWLRTPKKNRTHLEAAGE
jgi:hypothetical protein